VFSAFIIERLHVTSHIKNQLSRLGIEPPAGRVLLGVSGGMDSILLLRMLLELEYDVHAAHVNYGLRGEESDGDEEFVRRVTAELNVELHVLRVEQHAVPDTGRQEWARNLRYRWFEERCREIESRCVMTAHHLDDQLETVLLNLGRGTGPSGVCGMSPTRPLFVGTDIQLVRPLLDATRRELAEEAKRANLIWREDASNASELFERSALRNELKLMPEKEYHEFLEAGRSLVSSMAELRKRIKDQVREAEACFSIDELRSAGPWLAKWILLEAITMYAPDTPRRGTTADKVYRLLDSQVGRKVLLNSVVVWRERNQLLFRKNPEQDGAEREFTSEADGLRISLPGATICPGGVLECIILENETHTTDAVKLNADKNIVHFDAARAREELILRTWRAGDRFYPLGLDGSKKVKSFLTDQKIPSSNRDGIPVLVSGGEIVWVVGQRLDERYKISPDTEKVVRCAWIEE